MMKYALVYTLLIFATTQPVISQQTDIRIMRVLLDIQIVENFGIAEFSLTSQSKNEISVPFSINVPGEYYDAKVNIDGQIVPIRTETVQGWTTIEITPIVKINQNQVFNLVISTKFKPETTHTSPNAILLRFDWGMNYPVNYFDIVLTLPHGKFLTTKQDSLNLFPSTASLSTNGTNISVKWFNLTYTEPNNIQTVIVEYGDGIGGETKPNQLLLLSFGIIIGIAMAIVSTIIAVKIKGMDPFAVMRFHLHKPETEIQIKTIYKPIVLKPQQVRILEFIKQHEPVSQSSLIDWMGLSKSRISQYLKDLENHNLIVREKDGKENLVYLRQDVDL